MSILEVAKVQDRTQQRFLLLWARSCQLSGVPPAMRQFMRSYTTRNGGEGVTLRPPEWQPGGAQRGQKH